MIPPYREQQLQIPVQLNDEAIGPKRALDSFYLVKVPHLQLLTTEEILMLPQDMLTMEVIAAGEDNVNCSEKERFMC